MPQSFGLRISPSTVLQNLLHQYPSGGQFLSEALQNAEDTDRAGKFAALLDLRKHPCEKLRPPLEWRRRLQNEAIVFYDDGGFADKDWTSLQNIYKSEKRHSPHEAGMYGMGSRSFFHMTDVLQIASRTKLAVLDPDSRVTGPQEYGECIDLLQDNFGQDVDTALSFADAYPDECAPFIGLFGCTMRSDFPGTMIRAPLRAPEWAHESTFMSVAFGADRAEKVFQDFQETLKNGEIVLFLSRVQCVELWRWDSNSLQPTLLVSTRLGASSGHLVPRTPSAPGAAKAFLKTFDTFGELQQALLSGTAAPPEIHDLVEVTTRVEAHAEVQESTSTWMRFGKFFTEQRYLALVETCSTVPMVAIALPVDGEVARLGRAFTFLPLPVPTGLPIHMHASFRLQDNRRGMWRDAPDLEGDHKSWGQWNEYIVGSVVPDLYAKILEWLASNKHHEWTLWPRTDAVREGFSEVLEQFVEKVRGLQVLPTSPAGRLACPAEAVFIETPTPALESLRPELLQLCADRAMTVVDPPDHVVQLLSQRGALEVWQCGRVFREVLIPAAQTLDQPRLMRSLLAFLEWAGKTLKETDVLAIGHELAAVKWVPTVGGEVREIRASFDPSSRLPALEVVRMGTANLDHAIKKAKLDQEAVLRSLNWCGLKTEISWEDAVEEARSIEESADAERASLLLRHVEERHAAMPGSQQDGVSRLTDIEWVTAVGPCDPCMGPPGITRLRSLREVFAPGELSVVWAVAPTLQSASAQEPTVLKPGRSVASEPEILASQIRELCTKFGAPRTPEQPPHASAKTLEHLRRAFAQLARLQLEPARLGQLLGALADVAYIPCNAPGVEGAFLFTPRRAALDSKQGPATLSPAVGVVLRDATVDAIARAAGVAAAPRAEVLAEALESASGELSVGLARELANRVRDGEDLPGDVRVPTTCGSVEPAREVYIDDAPWRRSDMKTLHEEIGPKDGRALGCTSVRDQLARQCEGEDADGSDPFGQEADLVDQVKQLLQEYGGNADVVVEFIQNTDDFGAAKLSFVLCHETFAQETVVDERAATLQGPALYICSDKPLTDEAIQRMQRVGRSEKRLDFTSAGRFGVGLNVMYRYCDCPQLLANGHLHFFDLTRKFVARDGTARGRRFNTGRLRQDFPDSYKPFEFRSLGESYPVVFRLALRNERSELGTARNADIVRKDLAEIAGEGDKMLIFTRHLRKLSFHNGGELLAEHSVSLNDQASYDRFYAALPASVEELRAASGDLSMLSERTITTDLPRAEKSSTAWAVAHHVSMGDGAIVEVLTDMYGQPHGSALLPHGAAAVKLRPRDRHDEDGRVCCCLPTPQKSGSRAWIHGCFALLSSRKSLPLPEQHQRQPTLDQRWNDLLLRGPVAASVRALLTRVRGLVGRGDDLPLYFAAFPRRGGGELQRILAEAAFRACLASEVFPVVAGGDRPVRWIAGPRPVVRTSSLPPDVQDALSQDGLDLATIPAELVEDYEAAVGGKRQTLDGALLCSFLQGQWRQRHGEGSSSKELAVTDAGMACLSEKKRVLTLLEFAVKEDWSRLASGTVPAQYTYDLLRGTPLLLTRSSTLCAFGKEKFSNGWDILPGRGNLFVDKDILETLRESVDRTSSGVKCKVELKPPGIRPLKLNDLQQFKGDVEGSIRKQLDFGAPENHVWRNFWSLVGGESSGSWRQAIRDWSVLPVYTGVPWKNDAVSMECAENIVCVGCLQVDEQVRSSLTEALLACGISILNQGVVQQDRQEKKLLPLMVTSDVDVLELFLKMHQADGVIDKLSATNRHAILAYFAVRSLSDGAAFHRVRKMPLFMTAANSNEFTHLEQGVKYCCVDPSDRHAAALAKLTPPGTVLLAWPTKQVRPIFDHVGIDVISGEDFMVKYVVPCLPGVCRGSADGAEAKPYLSELHAYVVLDESHKVMQASLWCSFVVAADSTTMGRPQEFVDPSKPVVKVFAKTLEASVPSSWMCSSETCLQLLRKLGLSPSLSPAQLLKCAEHLHGESQGGHMDKALAAKSFELVEELSHALITGGTEQTLVRAASRHILLVRQHRDEESIKTETRRRDCPPSSTTRHDDSKFELGPFTGAAFADAVPLVWAVCPIAQHRHPDEGAPSRRKPEQLSHLLEYGRRILHQLGAYVGSESVPREQTMRQIQSICSCLPRHGDLAHVTSNSLLHRDLQACWEHVGSSLHGQPSLPGNVRSLVHPALPCVPVETRDEASAAQPVTQLAPPKTCFLRASTLRTCLRTYMREVRLTTSSQLAISLFTSLGVRPEPQAEDYARVTRLVAEAKAEVGVKVEMHERVIKACLRGISSTMHGCLATAEEKKPSEIPQLEVYMFDQDKELALASSLVWCDTLPWYDRCKASSELRFCKHFDPHAHAMARCLVKCGGLRVLSELASERHVEEEADPLSASALRDGLAEFIQSDEFRGGLEAMCHHCTALLDDHIDRPIGEAPRLKPPSSAKVRDAAMSIQMKSLPTLRSALYLRGTAGGGTTSMIAGSEHEQLAFFDAFTKVVYVRNELVDSNHSHQLLKQLACAVIQAMPDLAYLLSNHVMELTSILQCALDGRSVPDALRDHNIYCAEERTRALGPGDALPDELRDRLVDSMNETFGEEELVAVRRGDGFFLAVVLPWRSGDQAEGEGQLNRLYRVDLLEEQIVVKHFDLYRIQWKKAYLVPQQPTAIVTRGGAGAASSGGVGTEAEGDAAAVIEQIKGMLRQMGAMPEADYKAALHRLFRQWHPDKAGDTPLAKMMFCMIRRHEEWYRGRLAGTVTGSDDWLDEYGAHGDEFPAAEPPQEAAQSSAPAAYEPTPGRQASWFEEFERELRTEHQARAHSRSTFVQFKPKKPAQWQGLQRTVDPAEAERWLQQAEIELLTACKLAEELQSWRPLPAGAVWHGQQAVEMALKSAMLRTCGLTAEERSGHHTAELARSLRSASAMTEQQKWAQQIPIDDEDMAWLKQAYLAARYPNVSHTDVPAYKYSMLDAERAIGLARACLHWATHLEDLPEPGSRAESASPMECPSLAQVCPEPQPPAGPTAVAPQPQALLPPMPAGPAAVAAGPAAVADAGAPQLPSAPAAPPPELVFLPPERQRTSLAVAE